MAFKAREGYEIEPRQSQDAETKLRISPKTESWIRNVVLTSEEWNGKTKKGDFIRSLNKVLDKKPNSINKIYNHDKKTYEIFSSILVALENTRENKDGQYNLSAAQMEKVLKETSKWRLDKKENERSLGRSEVVAIPKRVTPKPKMANQEAKETQESKNSPLSPEFVTWLMKDVFPAQDWPDRAQVRNCISLIGNFATASGIPEEALNKAAKGNGDLTGLLSKIQSALESEMLQNKKGQLYLSEGAKKDIMKEAVTLEHKTASESLARASGKKPYISGESITRMKEKLFPVSEWPDRNEVNGYLATINNPDDRDSINKIKNSRARELYALVLRSISSGSFENGKDGGLIIPKQDRPGILANAYPGEIKEEMATAQNRKNEPLGKEEAAAESSAIKKNAIDNITEELGKLLRGTRALLEPKNESLMTHRTEQWLRERVLSGKEEHDKQAYLGVLNKALGEKDAGIISKDVEDRRVASLLETAYKYLIQQKPVQDRYFMDEGRIALFWKEASIKVRAPEDRQKEAPEQKTREIAEEKPKTTQGLVRASFTDLSEGKKQEQKYYIKILSQNTEYMVEFGNPARIPEGSILKDMKGSVTSIAINYAGSRAKVMRLAPNGTVAETYDLGNVSRAQQLSYHGSDKISVELSEPPVDFKSSSKSRFEIGLGNEKFIIESPRFTSLELAGTERDFRLLSAEEAIRKLLSIPGAKLYSYDKENNTVEIKDVESFIRSRLKAEDDVAVVHYVSESPGKT